MSPTLFYSTCNAFARCLGGDRLILWCIERVYFIGKPQARRALHHYLAGSGSSLAIDLERLIRTDVGLRTMLAEKVFDEPAGTFDFPQWGWADRDIRYAVGSVGIRWRRAGDHFEIDVVGRYDWNPAEGRLTQRVHLAAERMKELGARAFVMRGRARVPVEALVLSRRWIPRDRLYL